MLFRNRYRPLATLRRPTVEPLEETCAVPGQLQVLRARELVSPDGATWRVREALMPDGEWALIFDRQGFARRVRSYPSDWWRMDADGLWALSWSR